MQVQTQSDRSPSRQTEKVRIPLQEKWPRSLDCRAETLSPHPACVTGEKRHNALRRSGSVCRKRVVSSGLFPNTPSAAYDSAGITNRASKFPRTRCPGCLPKARFSCTTFAVARARRPGLAFTSVLPIRLPASSAFLLHWCSLDFSRVTSCSSQSPGPSARPSCTPRLSCRTR